MSDQPELVVCPGRVQLAEGLGWRTDIFVRAKLGESWGAHDIATLSLPSLKAWLRSRGGANDRAEQVVAALLGWHTELIRQTWPSDS